MLQREHPLQILGTAQELRKANSIQLDTLMIFLSVVNNLKDLRDHDTALACYAELQIDME